MLMSYCYYSSPRVLLTLSFDLLTHRNNKMFHIYKTFTCIKNLQKVKYESSSFILFVLIILNKG